MLHAAILGLEKNTEGLYYCWPAYT